MVHILLIRPEGAPVLAALHRATDPADACFHLVLESSSLLTALLREHLMAQDLLVLGAA
jgi:hypothetical protein